MKKIILTIALVASMSSFAQEKKEEVKPVKRLETVSYSFNDSFDNSFSFGLCYEAQRKDLKGISTIFNYNIEKTTGDHNGTGYRIESGARAYLKKGANEKFYLEFLSSYTHVNFSEANYTGVYDYFSIINASLGYKFMIGKHLVIDPSIGCLWKLEIMSRGDVDNKSFDNFIGKAGVKVGYRF